MPERATVERARKARRAGKAPSTQAGEFVREEIHHVREGRHGVRSTKQAIAIGLSKARRSGVRLPKAPKRAKAGTTRSGGGRRAVSRRALSRQAKAAARRRSASSRRAAARKAARTRRHHAAA